MDGRTALFKACENGHTEAVKLLLGHGADLELADQNGVTPTSIATSAGHAELAALCRRAEQPGEHKSAL